MNKPNYSLSWILPFVRESLRDRGNFTFGAYIEGVWAVLNKTKAAGITMPHDVMNKQEAEEVPWELRETAVDALFYLIHAGLVTPTPRTHLPGFDMPDYRPSSRGKEWAKSGDLIPEDYDG